MRTIEEIEAGHAEVLRQMRDELAQRDAEIARLRIVAAGVTPRAKADYYKYPTMSAWPYPF